MFGFVDEADKERQFNESLKDGMLEFPSGKFIYTETMRPDVVDDIINNHSIISCTLNIGKAVQLPNDGTARPNPIAPGRRRPLTDYAK